MEAVNIHIATNGKKAWLFKLLAMLTGGVYAIETVRSQELATIIKKGEDDFAQGKGQVFTVDELRKLTNGVTQH